MSNSNNNNSSGAGSGPTIDLDRLSLDQLNQLKQQEEARLQSITNRYAELRAAHASFATAKEALQQLKASSASGDAAPKKLMVPLTASLYVPGKIVKDSTNSNTKTQILVELGTGFYAEKTVKEANAFLERKIKLIHTNSENVMKAIQQLRHNVDSITMAMQGKLIEIRARQEGMRVRAEGEKG